MGGSTLENLSLAWYNYIDPDKTVEICNYMKSQAENGNTFFYDIYTGEEKKADFLSFLFCCIFAEWIFPAYFDPNPKIKFN